MREAAEPAVPAVRSIALMFWRADMALFDLEWPIGPDLARVAKLA